MPLPPLRFGPCFDICNILSLLGQRVGAFTVPRLKPRSEQRSKVKGGKVSIDRVTLKFWQLARSGNTSHNPRSSTKRLYAILPCLGGGPIRFGITLLCRLNILSPPLNETRAANTTLNLDKLVWIMPISLA